MSSIPSSSSSYRSSDMLALQLSVLLRDPHLHLRRKTAQCGDVQIGRAHV